MQIDNPLQANDWPIRKFLIVVLALQLAFWGLIGLEIIGLPVFIVRQLVGFIFIVFLPGLLWLRILRLHQLGNIQSILYVVGMSIATLMFTGLIINAVYPILGVIKPISFGSLIMTICIEILGMCAIAYIRDRDFSDSNPVNISTILSSPTLCLLLLPFLAIFGTYLMNFYNTNVLSMLLIAIIALICLLIGFDRFIPKHLYPLAILVIALSLLFHRSLISMYLTGWDIQIEFFLSNLVMENSQWEATLYSNTNAMLSIVMLAPILSFFSGINLVWVYKIIYPIFFSLITLALYVIFKRQTNEKIAFLGCFFFMSSITFYTEMLALARQQIAELFLVLLILLMVDDKVTGLGKSFLLIVFGMSLIVSHYGISYIFLLILFFAWIILTLNNNTIVQNIKRNFRFPNQQHSKISLLSTLNSKPTILKLGFLSLFTIFALSWYMYVSGGAAINTISGIGDHIISNIGEFLNPETAQGLSLIIKQTTSPLHDLLKYLHILTQFLIIVGILNLFLTGENSGFKNEYAAFAYVSLAIALAGIAIPYFASTLNTTRLYHITLIFLAPFCIIGALTFSKLILKITKHSWNNIKTNQTLAILSGIFVIFLLFNSGWVFEIVNDDPISLSLNNKIDAPRFNEQDVTGAKWLTFHVADGDKIFADRYRWLLIRSYEVGDNVSILPYESNQLPKDACLFLGSYNINIGQVLLKNAQDGTPITKYADFASIVMNWDKMYDNGAAQNYR